MFKRLFLTKINIWFVYFFFTAIITAIVFYFVFLIKELKVRETNRIGVFVKAMQLLQQNPADESPETQDLILSILEENNQLPVIVTDSHKQPLKAEGMARNIPNSILHDSIRLRNYIHRMENNYEPFEIKVANNDKQYVFYDNSTLLNNLQYYPFFLGLFVLAYLFFSLWLMRTIKKKDEGILWAGLAKETAHQIGTPLSSMIGWTEILKLENPNAPGVKEMEQDILRLKVISERFSKIGSVPELQDYNFNETVQLNCDYLKNRISTKVDFSLTLPADLILISHNRILFSWVIENLVKNAIDAMKGQGNLKIALYEKNNFVFLDFIDSGSGLTKKQIRTIFKPGYSTKKRGWGLGLSLAKRVVEDFHGGQIYVAQSELNKGSVFRIKLKSASKY